MDRPSLTCLNTGEGGGARGGGWEGGKMGGEEYGVWGRCGEGLR